MASTSEQDIWEGKPKRKARSEQKKEHDFPKYDLGNNKYMYVTTYQDKPLVHIREHYMNEKQQLCPTTKVCSTSLLVLFFFSFSFFLSQRVLHSTKTICCVCFEI